MVAKIVPLGSPAALVSNMCSISGSRRRVRTSPKCVIVASADVAHIGGLVVSALPIRGQSKVLLLHPATHAATTT